MATGKRVDYSFSLYYNVYVRKEGKQPISKLQRKLWQECRRVCKILYKNDCYTCGAKNLQGSNCQLGHLWAKASVGASLKYDTRILRWQCTRCNIWGGGMGADFYKRMLKEEGEAYMKELEQERQKIVKAYDHYVKLLSYYESIE